MAPSLLHPPSRLSAAEALLLSQRAPAVLDSLPSTVSSSMLQSVIAPTDDPEIWISYENLLLSCLRTGDIESARESLRRLVGRFGESNDRIKALGGIVREAEAEDETALLEVLKSYDSILKEDDSNIAIHKRRAALLRSLGRIPEAVSALVALLDFTPTDAEAWAELSDVYLSQGMYPQAVYALEEVLVLAPNAWNVHARLGEVQYMAATTSVSGDAVSQQKYTAESLKRFSRSIELCDDYLRGYYGLKLVRSQNSPSLTTLQCTTSTESTDKAHFGGMQVTAYAIENSGKWPKRSVDTEDFALPDTATLQLLSQLATEKLSEIVRRGSAKEPHWSGYDQAELAAARKLLAQETASTVR
ncbi:tetratricopeptide repeat domain containing protein [Grosmannia clavigera kw1407]|uniref:ER membrane protein complex subunit 2 n=1 Tax=Grosmannia clavigera (strain kw1407 / UAMH 11150) TaxID=655863 RepID=F0XMA1_GROCL|nr:tetratricopeptide repeat domain containing protein [Grosmannia clavigera kw1407]EFX01543.1 tetratricopeptide repeat domain containing protein [Grosmannia clavigera kw1407]